MHRASFLASVLALASCSWMIACRGEPSPAPSAAAPVASVPALPPPVTAPAGSPQGSPDADAASSAPTPIPLPGASGAVSLDYIACDRTTGRVYVPAGETASLDLIERGSTSVRRIEGFSTATGGKKGGPSSVTLGAGAVYVGSRSGEVCAVDVAAGALRGCATLHAPDGVAFVGPTREVWVTSPSEKALVILDASDPGALKPKGRIAVDGEPEGYAVDDARGLFYTNLEDADRTLAIDVRSRKVTATWKPGCGSAGPRGLALEPSARWLVVACTDHLAVLDAGHDGAVVSTLPTGDGVDNIDLVPGRHLVFAAAGRAARLTVARLDNRGKLSLLRTTDTSPGTRVVVADADGTAYVADPRAGRILRVPPP